MTAERPLARGSEVLGSYGHKSNARYLLNYGFTFPTNVLTPADVRPAFADAVGDKGGGDKGGSGVGELRCLDEVRLFFQLDLDDPHYTLKVPPYFLPALVDFLFRSRPFFISGCCSRRTRTPSRRPPAAAPGAPRRRGAAPA